MRIGLLGNFGSGNLGNDGSLEAMIRFLRTARPDAELVCICEDPLEIQREFKIPSIPIRHEAHRGSLFDRVPFSRTVRSFVHALNTAGKFDVLISPGTGLLDDFSDTPWGMPAILATWCAGARLRGTRIAFVSIGAGPIAHPISRWLFKAAARIVHYRSYRDTHSKDFLRSIGLNVDRDPVYPDLAFGLPTPLVPSPPPQKQGVTVGVGVMRYHGWSGQNGQGTEIFEVYLRKIVEFILWLLDRRFRVRLLIGDEADEAALEDVLSALALARPDYPRSALVIPEQALSLHDIMTQLLDTDFVVATRFHNIVCAMKMRKPCISIGYGPKFDALMAEMGLGQFCQHIERLDVGQLVAQLEALMSNEAVYRQALDRVNKQYENLLSQQEAVLRRRVLA